MLTCHERRVIDLGRDARILRYSLGCCPFVYGDPDATLWVRGWNEEDKECLEATRALEAYSVRQGRIKR